MCFLFFLTSVLAGWQALSELEKKEEALEKAHVSLLNDLYIAKQEARRKFLREAQARIGDVGGTLIIAQNVSTKLRSVVQGGMGISTRGFAAYRGDNPFLDNSAK